MQCLTHWSITGRKLSVTTSLWPKSTSCDYLCLSASTSGALGKCHVRMHSDPVNRLARNVEWLGGQSGALSSLTVSERYTLFRMQTQTMSTIREVCSAKPAASKCKSTVSCPPLIPAVLANVEHRLLLCSHGHLAGGRPSAPASAGFRLWAARRRGVCDFHPKLNRRRLKTCRGKVRAHSPSMGRLITRFHEKMDNNKDEHAIVVDTPYTVWGSELGKTISLGGHYAGILAKGFVFTPGATVRRMWTKGGRSLVQSSLLYEGHING